MTELQEGDELRLMMGGEVVGTGYVLPDGNASFQLDSGAVAWVGEKLVRGYSIEPEVSGGPSPSEIPGPARLAAVSVTEAGDGMGSISGGCDGSAACPAAVHLEGCYRHLPLLDLPGSARLARNRTRRGCGCLPGEECMLCRNSFAFRRELRPGETPARGPFFRQNWEAIQDELSVDLRGNPRPGFKRAPFPGDLPVPVREMNRAVEDAGQALRPELLDYLAASVEGIEVQALLCSTDSHAGTVPAVVFGQFRVPWWEEGRAEPAAYCGSCARVLGFMGYFTPDAEP